MIFVISSLCILNCCFSLISELCQHQLTSNYVELLYKNHIIKMYFVNNMADKAQNIT